MSQKCLLCPIRSKGTTHKISFTGESSQERFNKLVAAVDVIIKPFVIVNLLLDYLKDNKLEVGDLTIKPEGLYKKRTFWRSPEFLPWNGYYNTVISKGHVYVLKKDESKKEYSNFYTPSMSSINAVVLPDIINFLFARNGILDSATRDQIIERKAQLTLASAQDSIQNINQCLKCHEKLDKPGEICAKCDMVNNIQVESNPKVEDNDSNTTKSSSPVLYCSNCGNKIAGDLNFCGNCGTAISK